MELWSLNPMSLKCERRPRSKPCLSEVRCIILWESVGRLPGAEGTVQTMESETELAALVERCEALELQPSISDAHAQVRLSSPFGPSHLDSLARAPVTTMQPPCASARAAVPTRDSIAVVVVNLSIFIGDVPSLLTWQPHRCRAAGMRVRGIRIALCLVTNAS